MSKKKAVIVTTVMNCMLAAIFAFMLAAEAKIFFFCIGGIFAVVGIVCADAWLLDWLMAADEPEEDLDVPSVVADPDTQEQVASTVDEIMAEVKG